MDRGGSAKAVFSDIPLLISGQILCGFAPVAFTAASPLQKGDGSAWSHDYGELILEASRPLVS